MTTALVTSVQVGPPSRFLLVESLRRERAIREVRRTGRFHVPPLPVLRRQASEFGVGETAEIAGMWRSIGRMMGDF